MNKLAVTYGVDWSQLTNHSPHNRSVPEYHLFVNTVKEGQGVKFCLRKVMTHDYRLHRVTLLCDYGVGDTILLKCVMRKYTVFEEASMDDVRHMVIAI